MKKPEKPLPTDCCGTGCELCVYEWYNMQMEKYNAWLRKQDSNPEETQSDE